MIRCLLALLLLSIAGTSWASQFADLAENAIVKHPQIRMADLSLDMQKRQIDIQVAQMGWQLSVDASVQLQDDYALTSNSNAYATDVQQISLSKKLYDEVVDTSLKGLNIQVQQRQLELQETTSMVLLDLSSRFLQVLAEQNNLALQRQELAYRQAQLKEIRHQYKLQQVYITDLYTAESAWDQAAANVVDGEAKLYTVLANLNEMVDLHVAEINAVDAFQLPTVDLTLLELQAQAKANNTGLQAKRLANQLALNTLRSVAALEAPQVNYNWYMQRSNDHSSGVARSEENQHAMTLSLKVPLFQGGRIAAQRQYQKSNYDLIQQQYNLAERESSSLVAQTYHQNSSQWQRMEMLQRAIASAQKTRTSIEVGLTYGVSTRQQLLDASQRQFQLQRDFNASKFAYLTGWVQLQQLLGTLNKDYLTELFSAMEME